jgi:2-methylcitrate dehydratase PrpD
MTGPAAIARPATDVPPPTRTLAQQALAYDFGSLPADVVELVRQCLVDWFAVTLAAWDDPLVRILAADAEDEGGRPLATLVGRGDKVARLQAALVNGAAGHALDYDDVNLWMNGHPTVTIVPALLALAEGRRVSGREFIAAFVAGYETAARVGWLVQPTHYRNGFHATATLGAFASAAACAHLLGLDADRASMAFGIAGTQAAGLKSVFGSMCKPLHAGMAARAGLSAARWAARGFTSRDDILECAQGFAATHSQDFNAAKALGPAPNGFHIRNNLFKYHAACYLTHAPIECIKQLRLNHRILPEDVRSVTLKIDRETEKVCNIQAPASGLEAKFSLKLTTAFALAGIDTAAMESYSAANVSHPGLNRLRDKVAIDFQTDWPHTLAETSVELTDGRRLEARHDSGVPESDVARQGERIVAKYRSLAVPVLGETKSEALLAAIRGLETLDSMDGLLASAVR